MQTSRGRFVRFWSATCTGVPTCIRDGLSRDPGRRDDAGHEVPAHLNGGGRLPGVGPDLPWSRTATGPYRRCEGTPERDGTRTVKHGLGGSQKTCYDLSIKF